MKLYCQYTFQAMSDKNLKTKTYEYHFRNTQFSQRTMCPLNCDKNLDKFKNNESRCLNRTDRAKFKKTTNEHAGRQRVLSNLSSERYNQPLTKYTFSTLAQQKKKIRTEEDLETDRYLADKPAKLVHSSGKPCENPITQQTKTYNPGSHITQKSKQQKTILHLFELMENSGMLAVNPPQKQNVNYNEQKQMIKMENSVMKKLLVELKSHLVQKDKQIDCFSTQIKELSEKIRFYEQEKIAAKRSNRNMKKTIHLALQSNIVDLVLESADEPGYIFKKEDSTETALPNYDEQYKQVLELFAIPTTDENYHEKLIRQIDQLRKTVAELNVQQQERKQKESHCLKLQQHIQLMQAENHRLCEFSNTLTEQLTKHCQIIEYNNQQIERLNMERLNLKLSTGSNRVYL